MCTRYYPCWAARHWKDRASNTYYEIFRVSSWAFTAYIIILISAQPTWKRRVVQMQHTMHEVLQVRVNNPANNVLLYINCNAFHTQREIRPKRSQYIIAQLTTQALSLSAFFPR